MGRKQKKCTKKCEKHLLHLRPFHSMAYLSRDVLVSFCPASLKKTPNYPSFNKDQKHYTPTFCLKEDLSKYEANDSYYRVEHEKFCQEQEDGKSKLLVPKPRSKNQYCYVCKLHYDDYYDHVKSNGHKITVRKNKFSEFIDDLIKERYPRKILRPAVIQVAEKIEEQTIISSHELVSCPSMKSSSAMGSCLTENKYITSFRPLNGQGSISFWQLTKKQENRNISSIELMENKVFVTPQNEPKIKNPESEDKKSPNSTKFHIPIVLNSPLVLL